MTVPHVRPARPFDAGGVAALLRAHGASAPGGDLAADLRAWMAEPPALWLVAESAGEIVGLQRIAPPDEAPRDLWRIATFVAEPGIRTRGPSRIATGAALWQATERAARGRRLAGLLAQVPEGNAGAIAYYRSRGFEPAPAPPGTAHLVRVLRRR